MRGVLAALRPVWLIAEREFRTYVATGSFWLALAVGPLSAAGVMAFVAGSGASATAISLSGDAAPAAASAVQSAAAAEGRRLVLGGRGARATNLSAVRTPGGGIRLTFDFDFPLSGGGRQLVARTIERDAARAAGGPTTDVTIADDPQREARLGERLARLSLVVMLWVTLTGSLGMLLQSIVRERANRALETLRASASGAQIVFGKLVGVGAVSAMVLTAWVGSTVVLALAAPTRAPLLGALFEHLSQPRLLIQSAGAYLLAFLLFGLLTLAFGATARDVPSAQNYSRPMFALLLIAFFVALSQWTKGDAPASWLIFAPPFTPFLMLLSEPPLLTGILATLAVVACAAGAGLVAIRRLA